MKEKMTNCKTCNNPIAKNAKTCPNCGATNKNSIFKKWWFWLIIILLFVFMISLGSDDSVAPTEPNITTSPTSADTSSSTETEISTISDKYIFISENSDPTFNIQDKSLTFMNEHEEYFPGNDSISGAMSDYIDWEITYGHLSKNISKYGDKLIDIYGDVVDIEESDAGDITYIHLIDYDAKNYILYYLGSLDNVFEGSTISAYALPLDMITFENMSNTYTEAVACAACYVY